MDDAAFPMHVVQTQQDLFCDLLDQRHGDAAMIPPFDQTQEILAQDLEDHANVHAVGTAMLERVEQADHVSPTRVAGFRLDDLVEEFDLVDGGFGVVGGGSDDFQRDVSIGDGIAGQPDGGEVAPAQLADDDVAAVLVGFADADRVVAAGAVVFTILLLGRQEVFFVGAGR